MFKIPLRCCFCFFINYFLELLYICFVFLSVTIKVFFLKLSSVSNEFFVGFLNFF